MKCSPSQCRALVLSLLQGAGALRAGIASARPVSPEVEAQYREWIASGSHGEMSYLDRYHDVRRDPRLLLDGARSVIVAAFNYYTPPRESPLQWAMYALGDDYHEVIRRRLSAVAEEITRQTGAACRVTVDTAPVRERYWATRAGIGFIGRNNQLIIPGSGSYFFLGEIITTLEIEPDSPAEPGDCGACRQCVDACPGHALDGHGGLDARRCLSYLTIEYRGTLPTDIPLGRHVYGCDECQRACPHNRHAIPTVIPEFAPREQILALTPDDILAMDPAAFAANVANSAIRRTRLSGLQRNATSLNHAGT